MRAFLLVASLFAFAACGGDDSSGPTPPGTLLFKTDPSTCASGTVELFVDGNSQGQYVFSPPGAERGFTVSAGSHTAGAREVGGSNFQFPTQTVNVPSGGSYTYLMVC